MLKKIKSTLSQIKEILKYIIRVARSKFRKSGFYQDIFVFKNRKNQELFSDVQEIFISSLKDQTSIFFGYIIEN